MSSIAIEAINRIRRANKTEQKTGERTLWNAAPVPAMFTHSAIQYHIPPNGPGKMGDDRTAKDYDGTLKVYDVYGIDPKQSQKAREAMKEARKAGAPPESALASFTQRVVISSLDVAEHAVKKLAARGVVALTGDPTEDAELKDAARRAWIEFRRDDCDKILARYDARKAVFYAQPRNADQPPPPMTPRETEAFVWLADYRLGLSSPVDKFVCKVFQCGFQHEDADILAKHIRAYHPNVAHEYLAAAEEADENESKETGGPQTGEQTQKRGPGRPKKQKES